MTTSAPAMPADAVAYFEQVRSALADLPAADLEDLLEDLQLHLVEVAAEGEGSLAEQLGPPATYAAELRASAGLPALTRRRTTVLAALTGAGAAALQRPVVRQVAEFMPSLRPAWWVLRGYLAIAVPVFLRGRVDSGFPIPDVGGPVGGAVLVTAVVVLSVWVGQNRNRFSRARPLLTVVNIAIALLAVAATVHVRNDIRQRDYADAAVTTPLAVPTSAPTQFTPYLLGPNGRITNIYPYDSAGRPLHGVLLYDESGNPINLPDQPDLNGNPLFNHFPVDSEGNEIRNIYPVPQMMQPQDCSQPCPSAQVPAPQVSPATPTPTATPSSSRAPAAPRRH